MNESVSPPIEPMLAKLADALPAGGGCGCVRKRGLGPDVASLVAALSPRHPAATAAVGAALAALLIESQPAQAESEPEVGEPQVAVVSQHTPVCPPRRGLAGQLEAN